MGKVEPHARAKRGIGHKRGIDVICFGEILWDIFEDAKTRGKLLLRELGGAPANVAVGLSRLGLRSAVVGGVGNDVLGDALVALLQREGVSTKLVLRYPNRTGLTFVTRDPKGEPRFLFYRDRTADMAVRSKDITAAMGRARWVLFGTSTLMEEGLRSATHRLRDMARAARASVVVDLNVRTHLWKGVREMKRAIAELIADADLVKGSAADLEAVGGVGWVRVHAPAATLVMTGGAGAARAIGAHGDVEARTRPARCVDATGAGDAFLAGLMATLVTRGARPGTAAWKSPHVFVSALEVGHQLGKKSISAPGAIPGLVDLGEAKRAMRRS